MKTDKTYNSDITEQDKEKLGELAREIRNDRQGDDSQLENRERPIDFTGKDLDVPGRERATPNKGTFKDEENELYSQGSGDNDHLEDAENHQA